MKKRFWIRALIFAGAALLAAGNGLASTVVPLSLSDLVQQSDLALEGKIISGAPDWSGPAGASMLFTYWEVGVIETLKGTAAASLLVRTPGGSKDGRSLQVPGAPGFRPEQRLLLFLKRTEESRSGRPVYEVLGWQQGALDIETEPGSGEPVVRRPAKPSAEKPARLVTVKVTDLKREIQALAHLAPSTPEVSP